jgi:hypothetical protein
MKEIVHLKDVFAIAQGDDQHRARWTKIGIGFVNSDQSLNVVLDAMPINGRLHIRDRQKFKTNTKTKGESQ